MNQAKRAMWFDLSFCFLCALFFAGSAVVHAAQQHEVHPALQSAEQPKAAPAKETKQLNSDSLARLWQLRSEASDLHAAMKDLESQYGRLQQSEAAKLQEIGASIAKAFKDSGVDPEPGTFTPVPQGLQPAGGWESAKWTVDAKFNVAAKPPAPAPAEKKP